MQDQLISNKRANQATGAAAVTIATIAAAPPVQAAGVEEVTAMVTSLGGITAAVTTIIVGAMTVRLAIKMVNRLTVKG